MKRIIAAFLLGPLLGAALAFVVLSTGMFIVGNDELDEGWTLVIYAGALFQLYMIMVATLPVFILLRHFKKNARYLFTFVLVIWPFVYGFYNQYELSYYIYVYPIFFFSALTFWFIGVRNNPALFANSPDATPKQ